MNRNTSFIFALSLTLAGFAAAQDSTPAAPTTDEKIATVEGKVDGLNEDYLATKSVVDKLGKIKVGGYIQAQYQLADSNNIKSVAGGNFPANSNQRLQLRRVRLKTSYDAGTSQYIMEIEALPSGLSLKDAEVVLIEPWLKTFSLNLGFMDRPFGFEIPYSSSAHEAPERTRVYQTVFPGEKDLGVMLGVSPADNMGLLKYLNLKIGLYTGTAGATSPAASVQLASTKLPVKDSAGNVDGNGVGGADTVTGNLANGKINTPTSSNGDEIDSTFDLIGRVGFKAPFADLALAIDGGFSFYMGKSLSPLDTIFTNVGGSMVKEGKHLNQTIDRKVMGVDGQVYYTIPVIGDILGGTSIRGEYLWGSMPGTAGSNKPYGTSGTDIGTSAGTANTNIYERNFSGMYVSWIQNWGSMFQSVVKYDVFDPNTDADDNKVGVAGTGLTDQDLKYTTLGAGLIYYWDSNVRVTAYYDMVTNEKAGGTANSVNAKFGDDLADNVLTVRAQVKF